MQRSSDGWSSPTASTTTVPTGALSEAYGVEQGVFPLCVIDITDKVAKDVHYAVTAQDIRDYEEKYGPIPAGAVLFAAWPKIEGATGLPARVWAITE